MNYRATPIFVRSVGGAGEGVVSEAVQERLWSFSELPDGWHFGEGGPASSSTVLRAIELCSMLLRYGLDDVGAFPGIYGGITVTGYRGDHALEIFCDPNGLFDLLYEASGRIEYRHNDLSRKELDQHVGELSWRKGWAMKLWFCESSILHSSMKEGDALLAIPSLRHQVKEVYQLFQRNVLRNVAVANASILLVTMSPLLQEGQPSSGGYLLTNSPQTLELKKSPPLPETIVTSMSTT